jgi:3-hydroxyacyl-CoA dehydrogenase/enoyl-CoA hydratase/3-hydroxybutyryl-CoA epimerase
MNMNLNTPWQHWRLDTGADGITWLTLDKAHENVNTLSKSVMAELAFVLDYLDANRPKSLIIRSGKAAGFVAGADIGEFDELQSADAAKAMVERGWTLFNRLATVPYPTLALVRGHCLGGGLELALACRTLLVVDEPGTRLGLPEVMLGIFPGWGGMLRLPRRIGASAALDMMLTGKTVDAKRAKRLGLADECVPARVMESAARMLALKPPARRSLPLMQRLMGGPLKNLVAAQARKQVARRARPEHYPAPYAIIDLWARHGGNATAAPELTERIVASSTARNLVRVFRLQERLKGFGKNAAAGGFKPRRVHVVGAGVMGGDIAAWCALRGMTVTLQDQDMARIAPALQRAYALFGKRVRDPLSRRDATDRLIPDPSGQGARHADVVIEAIYEDLGAKQSLFRQLEALAKPDAVLATNTSSLRLEDIRAALKHPERLVGIHFFNPVPKMPLVEIVGGAGTDDVALARAAVFAGAIDKLPLPVKSAPGFLVNAVLAPYMLEAMRCVDEGIAPETVDEAALAYGMPMGPIELADTVGLDVALAAGKQLGGGAQTPLCLDERIQRGDLGRKTGKGFYDYVGGKPVKGAADPIPVELVSRLIAPILDRARGLVQEGIVADADLADAGVIFGTGYAPFTGGPLFHARE